MDERQTRLIQDSWSRMASSRDAMTAAFYDRLFELDPRIRDLFAATEMESQSTKFVAMLDELVRLARDPDRFGEALQSSGRRHAGYGVLSSHYATVGEALLWAMGRCAGPEDLDQETREAWAEAYTRMAFIMQRAR